MSAPPVEENELDPKTLAVLAASLLCLGALPLQAAAPDFPNRPIRLVVPFAPGGGTDRVGRTMATKMSDTLGQQMIVDNRPGAATTLASELVAKSAPDGYTLLLCALPHATNPSLFKRLPYDSVRDFAPITLTARIPAFLLVHPGVPARTVKELVALSKSKPRGLNYGSPGNGTAAHLGMELLKIASGLNATHIGYKGAGPQVLSVVGGETDITLATISTAKAQVTGGRLRAVAVATSARASQMPDVPTLGESGYPGIEAYAWFGLLAPAGTAPAVIQRLNRDANAALNLPDVREAFEADGIEPAPGTAAGLARYLASETAKWAKVIRQAGITAD